MRKLSKVSTYLTVGVLTLFCMSNIAFGSENLSVVTVPRTVGPNTYTHYVRGCSNAPSSDCLSGTTYVIYFKDGSHNKVPFTLGPTVTSAGGLTTVSPDYVVGIGDDALVYECNNASFTVCNTIGLTFGYVPLFYTVSNGAYGAENVFESDLEVTSTSLGLLSPHSAGYVAPCCWLCASP